MPMPDSLHRPSDGRGPRRVYVNGNEVEHVLWCDTVRGLVVFAPYPVRIKRLGDELYTRRLRGSVTVEQRK